MFIKMFKLTFYEGIITLIITNLLGLLFYLSLSRIQVTYNDFTMEIPSQELHDENVSTSAKTLIIDNED